jgi:hypothetical protein
MSREADDEDGVVFVKETARKRPKPGGSIPAHLPQSATEWRRLLSDARSALTALPDAEWVARLPALCLNGAAALKKTHMLALATYKEARNKKRPRNLKMIEQDSQSDEELRAAVTEALRAVDEGKAPVCGRTRSARVLRERNLTLNFGKIGKVVKEFADNCPKGVGVVTAGAFLSACRPHKARPSQHCAIDSLHAGGLLLREAMARHRPRGHGKVQRHGVPTVSGCVSGHCGRTGGAGHRSARGL